MSNKKTYFNYKSNNTHYGVNNENTVKLREVCLKHMNGRCSKNPSPENCNNCDEYE